MLCGIVCLINPQNLRIALQKYRYFALIQIVTPQSIWVLTFNLPCANIKYSLSERLWTKHCTWRSSFYFHCYDISMNEGEIVEKVTVEEVTGGYQDVSTIWGGGENTTRLGQGYDSHRKSKQLLSRLEKIADFSSTGWTLNNEHGAVAVGKCYAEVLNSESSNLHNSWTMTSPVYMAPSVIIWMNEYMFKSTPPNTSKGFFVNKIVIFAWQIEQFYMSRLDCQQSHHACNNHSTYLLDTSKW